MVDQMVAVAVGQTLIAIVEDVMVEPYEPAFLNKISVREAESAAKRYNLGKALLVTRCYYGNALNLVHGSLLLSCVLSRNCFGLKCLIKYLITALYLAFQQT